MNTRQKIQQRIVDDIIEAANEYRTAYRLPWDEPIYASGAPQQVLNDDDWLFLRLNYIYPEKTSD